jgi:hypothetical protein
MKNGKVYGDDGVVGSWTYSKGTLFMEDDEDVYKYKVLTLTSSRLVLEFTEIEDLYEKYTFKKK